MCFIVDTVIIIHRLCPMNDKVIRITYTERDTFSERDKPGVTALPIHSAWEYKLN